MPRPTPRRNFIRLVGGGAVLAATAPLAGCSSDYPAAAVAAWQGPREEPDLRRWALAHALLAPNSHNRQPWLADLREADAITLLVDRDRTLPMTDPWFRQIMVSQGTFLELLVIALQERGLDPQVQLFPQGEPGEKVLDDRPVARVGWTPGAPAPARDPLFAQILRRHTAKVGYDTARPVDPAQVQALKTVVPPTVAFGATLEPARVAELRTLCREAAKVEIGTPRTMMESLRLMRIGPAEIARHRDGITLMSPFVRVLSAVGLFDRTEAPAVGSTGYQGALQLFEEQSSTAMGFVWLNTDQAAARAIGRIRASQVEAGRAYVRLQLKATELGLQMHPMSQANQEFDEMKPWYDKLHQTLNGQPASERVVQMFCRIGYCANQPHTPRRELASVIRA
ncbi:MAG: twin-arginine translocation pathway signal protein [Burkholderiales bacterium]|nr:twin-arginine translocation pathway signal protein [Burkholderiales bacterium]MDZ4356696.1 twin-arginine translocation pathway signal protein [Variovorax sp.]